MTGFLRLLGLLTAMVISFDDFADSSWWPGKITLSGALHKVFVKSQNAFDRGS
jgi:hypothetical protein